MDVISRMKRADKWALAIGAAVIVTFLVGAHFFMPRVPENYKLMIRDQEGKHYFTNNLMRNDELGCARFVDQKGITRTYCETSLQITNVEGLAGKPIHNLKGDTN